MTYLKQNHLSLLIILWLVISSVFGIGQKVVVERFTERLADSGGEQAFGAIDRATTTLENPHKFTQGLEIGTRNGVRELVQNGSYRYVVRQNMTAASSTVCALAAPAATTQLVNVSWELSSNGTSTDSTFRIASSSTAFATTTTLFVEQVSGSQTRAVSFTPTTTAQTLFKSGQYVVVDAQGGNGGPTHTGICRAVFQGI